MLEELSDSKMFWLLAAAIIGLILGALTRRLTKSKMGLGAVSMPFIGLILALLSVKFVKLNVEWYDVKYTLIGIGGLLLTAILLGYISAKSAPKKARVWSTIALYFTLLSMIVFYIFYKERLPINVTQCQPPKDIYLLLKKEDAGYYEINEDGIGYTGATLFSNGFRPEFLNAGKDEGIYDHTPIAVEIQTSQGKAHALFFKCLGRKNPPLNLDALFEKGVVKSAELNLGELKK